MPRSVCPWKQEQPPLHVLLELVGRGKRNKNGFGAVWSGLQHLHEFVERILFSPGLNLKFSILNFDSVGIVQGKGQIGHFFFFSSAISFLYSSDERSPA